jgi:hypothetical protein
MYRNYHIMNSIITYPVNMGYCSASGKVDRLTRLFILPVGHVVNRFVHNFVAMLYRALTGLAVIDGAPTSIRVRHVIQWYQQLGGE